MASDSLMFWHEANVDSYLRCRSSLRYPLNNHSLKLDSYHFDLFVERK